MAIIHGVKGLEVTLIVDGKPLQEYEPLPDENDDSSEKVTRYVVAEAGKEFGILVTRSKGFSNGAPKWDLSTKFYVDGKKVRQMLQFLRNGQTPKLGSHLQNCVETTGDDGKWLRRNLMFSDIVFDNSAPLPNSASDVSAAKAMGEISVSLKRGTVGAAVSPIARKFENTDKVHEKTLKGRAISQMASLGAAQATTAPRFWDFDDYDKTPFATFIFKYRSMDDLKAEMVIPRKPSPVPLEERPRDSLTREELLELLARREAEGALKVEEMKRVKRERVEQASNAGLNDDDELEMVDPPPKRQRVVETVDLTSD